MNKLFRILLIGSLLFSTFGAKAVRSYRIYWDDPFIVEWIISDDFKVDIEQVSKESREYCLKLTGENSVIMFPTTRGAESYNDSNVNYFITGEDLSEYDPDVTYTLSERNGKIIFGNLKDDCFVRLYGEGPDSEDIEEYTPHKEFVLDPSFGHEYCDINGTTFKFSLKK